MFHDDNIRTFKWYVILQEKAPSHEAGHHPSSAAQHQQTRPRFFNAAAARRQRASYIYCRGPLNLYRRTFRLKSTATERTAGGRRDGRESNMESDTGYFSVCAR
jgi:hypothetical protein